MDSLDSRIVYQRAESKFLPSNDPKFPAILEGILTLKTNIDSVADFDKLFGAGFLNTKDGQKWLGDQIFVNDSNIDKTKPVTLKYVRYKDSVFNEVPVVVIVAKYTQ